MDTKTIYTELAIIGKALSAIGAVLETGCVVEAKRSKNIASEKKATPPVVEEEEVEDEDFAPKKKSSKQKAAASFDEEEETDEAEETEEAEVEEDEEDPAPKKKAKAKKITLDDVNDACKAKAQSIGGKEGRTQVLTILKKKFKTETVSALKPEQYQAVIDAMEV